MVRNVWKRIIDVDVPDPDDARRRRLLNIILLGVTSITALILLSGLFFIGTDPLSAKALIFGPLSIAINIGLYLLNRYYSGLLAGLIFIAILIVIFVLSDTPDELVAGRSLFFFSLPIVFASILLRPWMSFGVALVCSVIIVLLSYQAHLTVNTFAIGGFILLALFSWLSSSGIESAFQELRTINRELDDRVARRTEELAHANEQLTELDRLRSKFVADVSHELRTPVGNLVAYLEMLEDKMTDPERRKKYLEVLQEETTRLQNMVNSVLNLSRLELGTAKREFALLNINEIAQQVVLAHQLRAEAQGLHLAFEPDSTLPMVWADGSQINQVFNNIIGNAVNYTLQGGTVNVRTYSEMDKAVFEVIDTGIGIASEDIPYLFDRFYRGKNTGSSSIAGSGLGLAITKEIVESFNAQMDIKSELHKGTTFRIIFPKYVG